MGKIKKIIENELVGGTQSTDIYPVSAFKAIYNERNQRLDDVLNRNLIINVSVEYSDTETPSILTLSTALSKVPVLDRKLGAAIKFLQNPTTWVQYFFIGESISDWLDTSSWKSFEYGLEQYSKSNNKLVGEMLSPLSTREDLIGTVSSGFFTPSGDFVSGSNYKSIEVTSFEEDSHIMVSGGILGISAIFAQYWDNNGVIGEEKPSTYRVKDYLLTIPSGTTKIRISSSSTATFELANVDTTANISDLQKSVEGINNGMPTIPIKLDFEYDAFYNLNIPNKDNARVESSTYSALEIIVKEGDIFRYTSKVGGNSMAAITYYDENNSLIGYDGRGSTPPPVLEDMTTTVPKGATQLVYASNKTTEGIYLSKIERDLSLIITPLQTGLEDVVIESNNNNTTLENISEFSSKNLYEGGELTGYIGTGGILFITPDGVDRTTDLIKVKPNTFYYLSNRDTEAPAIRCVESDGTTFNKVRIASTGEESPTLHYYLPNEDGTDSVKNGQFKTSPTASYIQANIRFGNTKNPNYNKIMLEEVGDTYNPNFIPSPYEPYDWKYKIKESALPDISDLIQIKVNLKNSPVIMLTGASHGEGYGSVRDKAFGSYISAMSDWTVENYSLSGSDNIEHFNRIVQLQQISNVHPSNMIGGYSVVLLGGNEASYYTDGMNAKYFRENIIRLCSSLKSFGYEPILASYYGDMSEPWAAVVHSVAKDYGYMYIDLNGNGARYYSPIYRPWWYNEHYATRSNSMQWYYLSQALSKLERPTSAVKIFRNRINEDSLSELLFDDNYEKMKYWREISVHHVPLKEDSSKYVDRLDLVRYTTPDGQTILLPVTEGVISEYNSFRGGTPLSFPDKALLQFTLPMVGQNIEKLDLHIKTNKEVEVFIRQYISSDLSISLQDKGGAFHLTSSSDNIVVGDIYSDSNNPGIEFTVVEFAGETGSLITTSSAPFVSEGNMLGTLTKIEGLGSTTLNYDKLLDVPGKSYFDKALTKKGKWVQLVKSGDVFPIQGIVNSLDFDRMDFIIKAEDNNSFDIESVSLEGLGTRNKVITLPKDNIYFALEPFKNNQILPKTTFENALQDWGASPASTVWDGKVTYTDANGVQQTGDHIPAYFKNEKGVSKIIRLNRGESLSQTINIIGKNYECNKYKIKIVARYYPTEALDIDNLPSDVRTSNTFDFAKLGISYKMYKDSFYTDEVYVPLNFVEIEKEIMFDADLNTSSNEIILTALDDRIELILCEIYE